MRLSSLFTSFVLLATFATGLTAQVVTYTATGTIRLIANNFTDTISVGDTYLYTFSYNPTATPLVNVGTYRQIPMLTASVSVSNSLGNIVWSSAGNFSNGSDDRTLTLQNQSPTDRITFTSKATDETGLHGAGFYAGNTFTPVFAAISLEGPATVLTNTAVPTFYTLSSWNPYNDIDPASKLVLSFLASGGGNVVIRGSIDSLQSASAIPEPGTYAAVAGALALGMVIYRKRRAT